jgi:tetratricopeptide (TPR) repeat protein
MSRFLVFFIIHIVFLCGGQNHAQAVQWQALNGTTRYKAAYDEHSIRLTALGRLEVWVRFIPRSEPDRKAAATDYKDKRYRSHLEFYEIDCSDQTALLGLIDVLGASHERLKRLKGGIKPDLILPGSVLENTAQSICPVLDNEPEGADETEEPQSPVETDAVVGTTIDSETLQKIQSLRKATVANDASADTWQELGNLYFDTDQPEQAIGAYNRALVLRPDDADILNDQGAMYRQTGDFTKAVANFEKAFAIDPQNLESLYNCGYVYAFDLNNIPKAMDLWQKYLALGSKSETAQQVRSFIDRYGKSPVVTR